MLYLLFLVITFFFQLQNYLRFFTLIVNFINYKSSSKRCKKFMFKKLPLRFGVGFHLGVVCFGFFGHRPAVIDLHLADL